MLASGSTGNSSLVATDETRLLVDAGLSFKETARRLECAGESAERLDAILITHEHSDHIAGLARIAKRLKIPVYLTPLTAPSIDWNGYSPTLELFQAGTSFRIGDIEVDSFTIPHDAKDPVGFCFRSRGVKLAIVTDLGYVTDSVRVHLRGTNLLVLESNHDLDMLKVGPYPWAVKQRVMSRVGHLSNAVVSDFILEDLDPEVMTLVLGHLSEHNNHPAIARMVAQQSLERRGLQTQLVVASQKNATEVFEFAKARAGSSRLLW